MKRTHALLISLLLAAAVVLGGFAAIRSTRLSVGTATPRVDTAQIARQNAVLDRAEAALRSELRRRPPAIPPLPARPRRAAPPQTVVYKRAPTIIRVIHRHGGEREAEGGDNGSGLDD
jgi:hypothetical protein